MTTGGASPATVFDDGTAIPTPHSGSDPLKIGGALYSGARGEVELAALALVDGAMGSTYLEAI